MTAPETTRGSAWNDPEIQDAWQVGAEMEAQRASNALDELVTAPEPTVDLDALEALRKDATPGPWEADEIDDLWYQEADGQPVLVAGRLEPADARLIAAAVNALPALIAMARERDEWKQRSESWDEVDRSSHVNLLAERDAARAEVAALRDRVETEIEALRLLMIKQPITDDRDTYSDGFVSGLGHSIHRIRAALDGTP